MLYLQAIHFLLARWKTRDNYFKLQLLKLLRKYDWEMWTTRLALFFFLSVKICTCRLQNIQLRQIYEKVGLMFLTLEKIFLFAGWFEKFSSFKMYVQDRLFSLLWIALLLTSTGILLVTSQEGMFMNNSLLLMDVLNPQLPCVVTNFVFMFSLLCDI